MRALAVTCPPESVVGLFGEKLRKHRESRGLSLDAISTTTKISTRMLRAIEEEHFDQLPGGVFNKGFVRAYARQVGLDEEEVVNDYLAALRENHIQSQAILPNFRNPEVNSVEGRDTSSRNPPSHGTTVGNTDRKDTDRKDSDRNDNNRNISDRTNDFRGNNSPGNGLRASGPLRPRLPSEPVRLKDVASNPSVPDRRIEARRIEARRKDARRQGDRDLHPPGKTVDDAVPSAPLSFLNLTSAPSSSELSSSHPKQLEAAATVTREYPLAPDTLGEVGHPPARDYSCPRSLGFPPPQPCRRRIIADRNAATVCGAGLRSGNPRRRPPHPRTLSGAKFLASLPFRFSLPRNCGDLGPIRARFGDCQGQSPRLQTSSSTCRCAAQVHPGRPCRRDIVGLHCRRRSACCPRNSHRARQHFGSSLARDRRRSQQRGRRELPAEWERNPRTRQPGRSAYLHFRCFWIARVLRLTGCDWRAVS